MTRAPYGDDVAKTMQTLSAESGNMLHFVLNQQYRSWPYDYVITGDTMVVKCKEAHYIIPMSVVDNADHFAWDSPQADGSIYKVDGTFGFISRKAYNDLLQNGVFVYDTITWRKIGETDEYIEVRADIDRTEMRISKTMELPIVLETKNNPLGIDWIYE